jgi:hypothetical protein
MSDSVLYVLSGVAAVAALCVGLAFSHPAETVIDAPQIGMTITTTASPDQVKAAATGFCKDYPASDFCKSIR